MVALAPQVMDENNVFFCLNALSATATNLDETQNFHEQLTLRNATDCFQGKRNNLCAFI